MSKDYPRPFFVIDSKTGLEADLESIVWNEEWAKGLCGCDMEGFFIGQDGALILADECGNYVSCDPERFQVLFVDGKIPSLHLISYSKRILEAMRKPYIEEAEESVFHYSPEDEELEMLEYNIQKGKEAGEPKEYFFLVNTPPEDDELYDIDDSKETEKLAENVYAIISTEEKDGKKVYKAEFINCDEEIISVWLAAQNN